MARAKQPPRGTTKEAASPKVEDEAVAPTETEAAIEAADAARGDIVDEFVAEDAVPDEDPAASDVSVASEVAVALEEPAEARSIVADEVRVPSELTREPLQAATAATETQKTSFQVIVGEVSDYSKRSMENSTTFVRKLLGARSLESAILIQSEYAKTSYVDFVAHMTRIGKLYSKLATEVFERRSHVA